MNLKEATVKLSERHATEPLWLKEPIAFKRDWEEIYIRRDEVLRWNDEDYERNLLEIIKGYIDRAAGGDKPFKSRTDGRYTVFDEVLLYQCIAVNSGWLTAAHPQDGAAAYQTGIYYPTKVPVP